MKKIAVLLAGPLAAMLAGCNLTEKIDVEVNMRPTLLVEYPSDLRIRTMYALVYDPQGRFLDSLQVGAASKTGAGADTLLAGVPEGEYRVVCYGNLEQSRFSELEKGVSTLEQLSVSLDPVEDYCRSDELYHNIGNFTVRRGDPTRVPAVMVPKYYHVELVLQSEVDNPAPVTEYSARLEHVPGSVDGEGSAQSAGACCFVPELVTDAVNYRRTAEFPMNRFGDEHEVILVLFREGTAIARVPVLPSQCGVNPADLEEVVLPIHIEIAIDKLTVTILDWNTVIVQQGNVGE